MCHAFQSSHEQSFGCQLVHIGIVNSDIEVFNQYILDYCQALKNHGHDIDEVKI